MPVKAGSLDIKPHVSDGMRLNEYVLGNITGEKGDLGCFSLNVIQCCLSGAQNVCGLSRHSPMDRSS